MIYDVVLTGRAQIDLDQAYDWRAENRSTIQAGRCYAEFVQAMLTLEDNPQRRPLALENDHFPIEVRQINFGVGKKPTHRALFTIRNDRVVILRVRRVAQQPVSPEDL